MIVAFCFWWFFGFEFSCLDFWICFRWLFCGVCGLVFVVLVAWIACWVCVFCVVVVLCI